jgi:two-component system, sensor histidine kinase PdtaS
MRLSAFKTVQSRLLALMAFIIIPIAALIVVLASANYRAVVRNIEAAQIQTASNFAVRARLWYRGSSRTLVAAALSVDALRSDNAACNAALQGVLKGLSGFQSIRMKTQTAPDCHATEIETLTSSKMDAIISANIAKPFVQVWSGASLANIRYDSIQIDGTTHILIYARNADPASFPWEATLLVDPVLVDRAFEIGTMDGTTAIALMNREKRVIVSRGPDESNISWLPQNEIATEVVTRWDSVSSNGTQYTYASQIVALPDLYVLARFNSEAINAATMQFFLLCFTPLIILTVLFMTYAKAIQSNVLGWIGGIERAARSRQQDMEGTLLAPLDEDMPQDIRSVAEAFNGMVEEARKREFKLKALVTSNTHLVRELHHRVKNSLQVIQSFMALSRRQQPTTHDASLADMEAKVQVLSTAYRLGLSEAGLNPVMIKPFVDEIVENVSSLKRKSNQWINLTIDTSASLVVDRVIPLGLAIVEAVGAGLSFENASIVTVEIVIQDNSHLRLTIATNGVIIGNMPWPRIMDGLASQLGATALANDKQDVLNWTFET